jgi:mono/diheme cytochrome c family protein
MSDDRAHEPVKAPLHGLLAEYDNPTDLVRAAEKVRDAKYERWDTFTPFPIHGMDPAMGIKPTVLPWIVLGAGLTGCATGLGLQWWTSAVDYPWIISGKPFWSVPANIPITFELTVLFSALTALGAMLVLNGLPHPSHPLDLKKRFARVTDDRFFLLIEARDGRFDEKKTRALLEGTHPALLDEVLEDRVTSDALPKVLVYGLVVLTALALVPFALAARARVNKNRDARIHIVPDMDNQPKVKTQKAAALFGDARGMRSDVPGSVAYGQLEDDDHLHRGKLGGAWARTFPPAVEPTAENMKRGQERFGVYCAPCHGLGGKGDGMVHVRADALQQGTWVQPTNVSQDYLRQQPVGELFNSISRGVRNMPGYERQISVEDRWKILLYVRALQRSNAGTPNDLPEGERGSLK